MASDIADEIVSSFKELLKDKVNSFSKDEMELVQRSAKRMAEIQLARARGEDVDVSLKIVMATINNLKVSVTIRSDDLFWKAVNKAAGIGGEFVAGFAKGMLLSLI